MSTCPGRAATTSGASPTWFDGSTPTTLRSQANGVEVL
jgi:hypothetical protein